MRVKVWHKILLSLMILYDVSLHWVEVLDVVAKHPFYPSFPLWGLSYNIFWTSYWTIAFVLSLWIIFGRGKN